MSPRILPTLLAAAVLMFFGTACAHSTSKSKEPKPPKTKKVKPSSTPAAEMEAEFKAKWVAKRTSEWVAKGISPEESQARALREFSEIYPYVGQRH